jgi:hypothetical protein
MVLLVRLGRNGEAPARGWQEEDPPGPRAMAPRVKVSCARVGGGRSGVGGGGVRLAWSAPCGRSVLALVQGSTHGSRRAAGGGAQEARRVVSLKRSGGARRGWALRRGGRAGEPPPDARSRFCTVGVQNLEDDQAGVAARSPTRSSTPGRPGHPRCPPHRSARRAAPDAERDHHARGAPRRPRPPEQPHAHIRSNGAGSLLATARARARRRAGACRRAGRGSAAGAGARRSSTRRSRPGRRAPVAPSGRPWAPA